MNIKIHHLLPVAFVFFLFMSCNSNPTVVGGPCTYNISKLPATVIAIQQHDNLSSEILFTIQKDGKTDTLWYTREFPGWATADDVKKYDLKVGNQFVYECRTRTSGECTPEIDVLKLEKY